MTILQLLHKWNFFTGISAHFWSNSVWNANTSSPVQFGAKLTKSEKIFTSTATLLFFFTVRSPVHRTYTVRSAHIYFLCIF